MTVAIMMAILVVFTAWLDNTAARPRLRRLPVSQRRDTEAHRMGEVELCELVALGLSAGLSFSQALAHAASVSAVAIRHEVDALVRRMRTGDIESVLAAQRGSLRNLAIAAARTQLTGAPLLPAVEALGDELTAADRSRRLAAARKLPVKLAIPLALLILPGFVLLVTAPAVVTTLERLQI